MWDLNRLRMLRELEWRQTVTAVAAALHYSPSTVSQQLARLEEEVGLTLLEPDGRRVRLTAAGVAVARYATQALDLQEQAEAELSALHPETGTVRISSLETIARAVLPRALAALRETHPHLRIEGAVIPPEQGLFELEARSFDLAIAEQYPGHTRALREGIDRVVLGRDPIRVVLPLSDPARSIADLRDRPWVVEPAGTAAHEWTLQQCRAAGFEPDVRFEAADLQAHIQLVASGAAVSVLPDLVWAEGQSPVRVIDLPGAPHREVFTSARAAAASRPALAAVREALAIAFADVTAPAGAL